MKQTRFLKPTYFVWLIIPAAMMAIYLAFGLPHVVWSYDWLDNGRGYGGDFSQRYYSRCTYFGPHGSFTIHPIDRKCGWFIWRKPGAGDF